jgi:hypothetical protein
VTAFVATDSEVRFQFPALPDFLEVVGQECGPPSLVSKIEKLFGRKSSVSGLENLEYDHCAHHTTPSICKMLTVTSPTSGGHLVSIVRSWTKAHRICTLITDECRAWSIVYHFLSIIYSFCEHKFY